MKILYFCIFTILLLNISSFPQSKWQKLKGPGNAHITAIYSDKDILLVGAGKKGSLYKSDLEGNNREEVANFGNIIRDLFSLPDNSYLLSVDNLGIYKSFDLKNWVQLYRNISYPYLGRGFNQTVYMGGENGILSSSDFFGISWQQVLNTGGSINEFLTVDSTILISWYTTADSRILRKQRLNGKWEFTNLIDGNGPSRLTFDDKKNIYAATGNYFYMSSDSGKTFIKKDSTKFFLNNYWAWINDIHYNNFLFASLSDYPYLDPWGIAVSKDKGDTWEMKNSGLPRWGYFHRITSSGSSIFAGSDYNGLYKTKNYGECWYPINDGFKSADVSQIIKNSKGHLFTIDYSNNISRSTDDGMTWKKLGTELNEISFRGICCNNKDVLFANSYYGIFKSTDNGNSWERVYHDLNIGFIEVYDNKVYAFTVADRILRSDDAGVTWKYVSSLPRICKTDISETGEILVGTIGGNIFKSIDEGKSWGKIFSDSIYYHFVSDIKVAKNGFIFAAISEEGLFRSTDNGLTWIKLYNLIGSLENFTIGINSWGSVFIKQKDGLLYISKKGDTRWLPVNSLKKVGINTIFIDNKDYIYVGSEDGIWKSAPDSVLTDASGDNFVLEDYKLYQNFPNPFNPTTTIKYSIPKREHVSLSIYNVLGSEIAILENNEKEAGEYEISWNASTLPSGVYFCRIKAGSFMDSKKLLLVK